MFPGVDQGDDGNCSWRVLCGRRHVASGSASGRRSAQFLLLARRRRLGREESSFCRGDSGDGVDACRVKPSKKFGRRQNNVSRSPVRTEVLGAPAAGGAARGYWGGRGSAKSEPKAWEPKASEGRRGSATYWRDRAATSRSPIHRDQGVSSPVREGRKVSPHRNDADNVTECPVPLTVRGTQVLVGFAPLAPSVFCAARQDAVLRRSLLRPT